jgi:hypothetical protein
LIPAALGHVVHRVLDDGLWSILLISFKRIFTEKNESIGKIFLAPLCQMIVSIA